MKKNSSPLSIRWAVLSLCFGMIAVSTLQAQGKPPVRKFARAPFMGPMLIHMPSTKIVEKKTLDFYIDHRFGSAKDGFEDFLGFDKGATMQLAIDYGFTDSFSLGFARNSAEKTYELRTKYNLFEQRRRGSPFGIAFFGVVGQATESLSADMGVYLTNPPSTGDQYIDYYIQVANRDLYTLSNSDKRSYLASLLISRRFNRYFSLQVSPMFVHRNWVKSQLSNDNSGVSVGGRVKISKRVDVVFESIFSKHRDYVGYDYNVMDQNSLSYDTPLGPVYTKTLTGAEVNAQYPLTNAQNIGYVYLRNVTFDKEVPHYYVPASIGFDIDTGGHVFNVFISNSTTTTHTMLLRGAQYDYSKGDYVVGFNIHRVFWFDERSKMKGKNGR